MFERSGIAKFGYAAVLFFCLFLPPQNARPKTQKQIDTKEKKCYSLVKSRLSLILCIILKAILNKREEESGMKMPYTDIANSTWMFLWVSLVIATALLQCAVFMRRAWKRARALGLENVQIRKGLKTGITVSILPTIPVLVVLITLMPLLGVPLPWLRLSVVGSAMYETAAASVGIQAVGEEMVMNGYSAYAWAAAVWTMSFGASMSVLWSSAAIRPVSGLYDKLGKFDVKLVLAVGAGCMAGIMAYASTIYGFSDISGRGVVFLASFGLSLAITLLVKKMPKFSMLGDFTMAVSMVFGMIVACLVF